MHFTYFESYIRKKWDVYPCYLVLPGAPESSLQPGDIVFSPDVACSYEDSGSVLGRGIPTRKTEMSTRAKSNYKLLRRVPYGREIWCFS
jgi:hypothetical protein